MTTIAIIVGSLRADSLNKKLAHNLEKLAPEGVDFSYVDINMPLFNGDLESNVPDEVRRAKAIANAVDGILIITPEYNRGIPGPLKNALDWLSRPLSESPFNNKPLGIAGATHSAVGTAVAQSDLRHVAGFLNTRTMGQPELYFNFANDKLDDKGEVVDEYREQLRNYMIKFIEFVQSVQG